VFTAIFFLGFKIFAILICNILININTSDEEPPQLVTPKKKNPKGKVGENCSLKLIRRRR
jgi:hypothetical protein